MDDNLHQKLWNEFFMVKNKNEKMDDLLSGINQCDKSYLSIIEEMKKEGIEFKTLPVGKENYLITLFETMFQLQNDKHRFITEFNRLQRETE